MTVSNQRRHAHPFLRALVPEHRFVVLQGAQEQTSAAGEILFREGQPANRLYLIEQGQVALETHVPGRGDVPMATLGPGQVLGWSWLVPPYVWHFQARALQPSQLMVLNGGHLLVASEQNHYLGYELMKNISKVILEILLTAHQRWLDLGRHPGLGKEESSIPAPLEPRGSLPDRVGDHPFFHGMLPANMRTMEELAAVRELEPGQTLFNSGDPADGLYLLEQGRLLLQASLPSGSVPVQILRAGDAVGWSSFCEPYEWQFQAQALDTISSLFFKAADLRERCAGDYHFGYDLTKRIARMMLQRLQATRNRVWEASR
jgi:CRP/FNR family transcriptional regulator, cyclic AMP receptor protein